MTISRNLRNVPPVCRPDSYRKNVKPDSVPAVQLQRRFISDTGGRAPRHVPARGRRRNEKTHPYCNNSHSIGSFIMQADGPPRAGRCTRAVITPAPKSPYAARAPAG